MKKSNRLLGVFTLIFLALVGRVNAAMIASDTTAITGAGHSDTETLMVSPSPFSETAWAFNVPGDSVRFRPDEDFKLSMNTTLPVARPHADSHPDLWLLLIVAVIAGGLSEILHRRSQNR
jgi:hypothetical protein